MRTAGQPLPQIPDDDVPLMESAGPALVQLAHRDHSTSAAAGLDCCAVLLLWAVQRGAGRLCSGCIHSSLLPLLVVSVPAGCI